jgi:hypothetical protein
METVPAITDYRQKDSVPCWLYRLTHIMTLIQRTLQKIDKVDPNSEDAIDTIHKIVSTELRKLPIFMTDLFVGEPLVRSRYLTDKEDFHHTSRTILTIPFRNTLRLLEPITQGNKFFMASGFA